MMVVEYIRCNLTNTKTAVEPPPNTAMITASGERGIDYIDQVKDPCSLKAVPSSSNEE